MSGAGPPPYSTYRALDASRTVRSGPMTESTRSLPLRNLLRGYFFPVHFSAGSPSTAPSWRAMERGGPSASTSSCKGTLVLRSIDGPHALSTCLRGAGHRDTLSTIPPAQLILRTVYCCTMAGLENGDAISRTRQAGTSTDRAPKGDRWSGLSCNGRGRGFGRRPSGIHSSLFAWSSGLSRWLPVRCPLQLSCGFAFVANAPGRAAPVSQGSLSARGPRAGPRSQRLPQKRDRVRGLSQ